MPSPTEIRSEHPFHMFDEIQSQPKIVNAVFSTLSKQIDHVAEEILQWNPKKIFLIGCGTSYNAALEGRYVLSELTKFDTESFPSFELGSYVPTKMFKDACVIAISSSGATKATHGALNVAKRNGSKSISIIGLSETPMEECSDEIIITPGGKELSRAVTRSYLSQIVVLSLLSVRLAERCGNEQSGPSIEVEMKTLPERIGKFVEEKADAIRVLAKRCLHMDGILFAGAGPNWPTAIEGSLKTVEVAHMCSMGFELEEILHGPRVLLNKKKAVVMVEPGGRSLRRAAEIMDGISELKSWTVAVTSEKGATPLASASSSVSMGNGLSEILTPILYVVPLQLFAYFLSVEGKMNPDTLREDQDFLRSSRTAATRFS